jgi:TatD DNase family protein
MVDSHCHLDDTRFDADRDALIDRALAAGIDTMVSIGTGDGPPDIEVAVRVAERYECVRATVGVHPHDASKATPETYRELEALLKHPKVVGLGECGLDYHYMHSPREVQIAVFREQIELAKSTCAPLIIHTREAWDETLSILDEHWAPAGLPGVMHCFSGGVREADLCLRMGFLISFAGVVTFPKAIELHEAAKIVPDDMLLIETDAPYLAPVPHRGKRNEPAFVAETAKRLAVLRGTPPERIAEVTTANWHRVFAPLKHGPLH